MEDNVRKGFLENSQYTKLLEANPKLWFRALVEMGRTYGRRISELLGLRVGQIDLDAHTIRLDPGTTKNREGREVTMTGPVHALLSECVAGKAQRILCSHGLTVGPLKTFAAHGQRPRRPLASLDCSSTTCAEPPPEIFAAQGLPKASS
jgi:integrase